MAFFVTVHSPWLRTGLRLCSADKYKEIADHLPQLLTSAGLDVSIIEENIFVLVYPSNLVSQDRLPHDQVFCRPRPLGLPSESVSMSRQQLIEMSSVDVYVVPLAKGKADLSLNEIRNLLRQHYDGEKVERIDCLSVWRKQDDHDDDADIDGKPL